MFVIAGPSGVGKGTVVRRVLGSIPGLFLSVSCTTRRPRPVEREGVEYFFVTGEEFDRMIADDELLEGAGWELEQRGWFDHAVVNEDVGAASAEVAAIIGAFRQVSDPAAKNQKAEGTQEGSPQP